MKKQVILYTDGSCRGNPGPGGWGLLLEYGGRRREFSGAEPHTTNNRMELLAVIKGMEALKEPCSVQVVTDSRYVMQGITQWMANWKRNNWKTADRKAVKNQDLWTRLDQALQSHQVQWRWVRGHSGHPQNERADQLASGAIDRLS